MAEYNTEAEDKWFKWKGVKPPERNPHLTEEEIEQLLSTNLARHKCEYHQNGAFIVCDTDEFEHGKKIPTGMILDKEASDAQGGPVFKKYGAVLRD